MQYEKPKGIGSDVIIPLPLNPVSVHLAVYIVSMNKYKNC